jgi:hypothetical protein
MAEVGGGRETSGADRSRAPQGKNCSSRTLKLQVESQPQLQCGTGLGSCMMSTWEV